jgi:hypothetical protein
VFEAPGARKVQACIPSGNAVFASDLDRSDLTKAIAAGPEAQAGLRPDRPQSTDLSADGPAGRGGLRACGPRRRRA